jgi:hypothetical protein
MEKCMLGGEVMEAALGWDTKRTGIKCRLD